MKNYLLAVTWVVSLALTWHVAKSNHRNSDSNMSQRDSLKSGKASNISKISGVSANGDTPKDSKIRRIKTTSRGIISSNYKKLHTFALLYLTINIL